MSTPIRSYRLGRLGYAEAYQLQLSLSRERSEGQIPDCVLFVEHPPTLTMGKSGKIENVRVSQEELKRLGVSFYFSDRGGDVTYHGPGQLVAYPIVDLRERGRDVHAYVHDLEETIIGVLDRFGIASGRRGHPGVWVGNRQIAAIGIAVRRWVTMHGIALNVRPQQTSFNLVNPCGMAGVEVTSVDELARRVVPMSEVEETFREEFSKIFNVLLEAADGTDLLIQSSLSSSRPVVAVGDSGVG